MSKHREQKKRKKTENVNENVEVDDQEILNEKNKLSYEIALLKLRISQAESSMDITTFGNICKPQIDASEKFRGHFNQLIDVNVVLRNELFSYTGFCCKKPGPDYVFAFKSIEKILNRNNYWVQLLKIEEHWQLGKWVMPPSVDIKGIADKCPISSAESIKLFLMKCKHDIDCYNRRAQKYKELEDFVENLEHVRCLVESNYGYTQIIIKLVKFRCESPDEPRNILVYLWYKGDETRPCKLQIDCEDEKELSDDETMYMRRFFRKHKEQDLTIAIKKILTSEGSPFTWNKSKEDDTSTINTSEDDEGEETTFLDVLKNKSKIAKKRWNVVIETDQNQNEVTRDDDNHENDLSDDYDNRSSPESGEEDKSQNRTERNKKKRASKKTASKIKAKETAKNKSKTSKVTKKKSPQLKKINEDKVANIVGSSKKDGKENTAKNIQAKSRVPEMFKRRTEAATEVSKVNEEAASSLLKPPNKKTKSVRKSSANTKARNFRKILSSTPIGKDNARLPIVVEENISAITRENTTTKKIVTNKNNEDTSFKLDDTDVAEFNGNDATRVEKSQRVLLKDLRAVKNSVLETKKSVKRRAESPVKGRRKKVDRK